MAVLLALVHEHLVAHLPGGAGEEVVLELGLEQRRPEIVERARQALGAATLPGGYDDAHVLRREGLRAGERPRAERSRGGRSREQTATKWVRWCHLQSSLRQKLAHFPGCAKSRFAKFFHGEWPTAVDRAAGTAHYCRVRTS
jgi:hypothetical protein